MTSKHTSCMAFTFDVDAEEMWLGEDPAARDRPVTLSQGTYGPRVAVPAILTMLDRYGIRATFFVPGRVAERYPDTIGAIAAGGHEIAHHGYTHRAPASLTPQEEVEEFERSIAALRAYGVEPVGYRAPSWDFSPETLGLVEKFGFGYSSNFMSDIRPFRHPGSSVIELPVHWILDDAAHYWFGPGSWTKKISTNSEVLEIVTAESDGIAAMGGSVIHTFHPQIIGRPGRLAVLEELMRRAVADDTILVDSAARIAEVWREELV